MDCSPNYAKSTQKREPRAKLAEGNLEEILDNPPRFPAVSSISLPAYALYKIFYIKICRYSMPGIAASKNKKTSFPHIQATKNRHASLTIYLLCFPHFLHTDT